MNDNRGNSILDGVATGVLVAVAVSVTSGVAMAFAFGGLTGWMATAAFGIGVGLGLIAGFATKQGTPCTMGPWDVLMVVIFALASLRAFLWLIYPVGDEWRILSPYNLGDISLHIHFIRYMAAGAAFWPESPILGGVPLTYPIGADFFNSLLLLVGMPVERGLIITGLAGSALACWALWRWGGAFVIAAFLFNGGLAGFAIFSTWEVEDFQSSVAWKNFFLTMLVTQRGLLYALPCGLLLLRAWRDAYFGDGSNVPVAVRFFLYVTMPLFSIHAFLFLSFALASIFIFQARVRWRVLAFVFASLLPATLGVWLVTGGFSAASGLRWLPGWMQRTDGWLFWPMNFGLALPLLAVLFWKGCGRGNAESRAFSGVSIGVLVLCCFVSFAPWEWDNTKLMVWSWLVAAPFLWKLVIKPLPGVARGAVCVALFFSGAVSLIGGLDGRHGYVLASRSELSATELLLRQVPPLDRIAVEPEFNNPAILLGRPVVCGYEGHLWSHGLNYRESFEKLRNVLEMKPGWESDARDVGAKWIYWKGKEPHLIRLAD